MKDSNQSLTSVSWVLPDFCEAPDSSPEPGWVLGTARGMESKTWVGNRTLPWSSSSDLDDYSFLLFQVELIKSALSNKNMIQIPAVNIYVPSLPTLKTHL